MRIKKLKKGHSGLTKEKARIIAHLIGDGAHYQTKHDYVLKYEVRDSESLRQFNDDIIKVYGLNPSLEWNTSSFTGKRIRFIRLRSKLAFEDLLKYSTYFSKDWKIKLPILNASIDIKKEFLKALFDDEGSVIPQNKKCLIRLYSINLNGLKQIQKMLLHFKINSKIVSGFGCRRNVFALTISDYANFHTKIGFGLSRKQEKLKKFAY